MVNVLDTENKRCAFVLRPVGTLLCPSSTQCRIQSEIQPGAIIDILGASPGRGKENDLCKYLLMGG